MKIIHFACVGTPQEGGIGRIASQEVASLSAAGHDAHLISLSTHAAFRVGNMGSIHALEHFVRDADIVHLHYPFYGTAGSLARLRKKGIVKKLVLTLHMDATASGVKGKIFDLHRKYFQKDILDSADALLASSTDYVQHSSFATYAGRVVELPFGVNEHIFCPGSFDRRRFDVADDSFVVLFVGGMDRAHAFKGVPGLIEAIASVPDAYLVLVGDGGLRASYEKLAVERGVADRCHFMGRLADDELVNAYRSANVLAFPSVSGAEAFGLVALEAQACGTPVIASDLPGVRTVVADQQTGLLVPPGNVARLAEAVRLLKEDHALCQRLADATRPRVLDRFTWTKHMEGLENVYHTL